MPYPTHEIGNCESCHAKGTYDVQSQDESLPGILSASAKNETWDRKVGTVPVRPMWSARRRGPAVAATAPT